jgi:hypothetical protein
VPPATAAEAPDPVSVFSLDAAGGYEVTGVVGGPQNSPARLGLFVAGPRGSVIYTSFPATYDEESGAIVSNLGALGAVDLVFHATGGTRQVRSSCGGEGFPVPLGAYEGSVVFRGEQGYTQVTATRARPDPKFMVDLLCSGYGQSTGSGRGAVLNVHRRHGGSPVSFTAIKNGARKRTLVSAGIRERVGDLSISRSTGVSAGSGAFLYPPMLGEAFVSPPAPFSGSARFTSGRDGNSWLGSLSVDFPGRAGVRLAGTGFEAGLQHAHYELFRPRGPAPMPQVGAGST